MKFNCLSSDTEIWENLLESDNIFSIFWDNNGNRITSIRFWDNEIVCFESDFDAPKCSGVKFKAEPFSLSELSKEKVQSLFLGFKTH